MYKLVVEGGARLEGTISASGSKNAALPLLFASILTDQPMKFKRVPVLRDIATTLEVLRVLGCEAEQNGNHVTVSAKRLTSTEAPYDLVRTMRASILVLGPLLAREKRAKVSLPGGCAIGTRPVDLHLFALEKMGARFDLQEGYILGECPNGLHGAEIEFRTASVGATENTLMAAALARGKTVIKNAAREPEIVDLARTLRLMGAKIIGEGTSEITIEGVSTLHGCETEVMFDRIEAGTLLFAGPITGGRVRVEQVEPLALAALTDKMKEAGLGIKIGANWIEAEYASVPKAVSIATAPFPGFATDLQAQFMAYLAQVPGESLIDETIFENRFMHVPELNRMGADIRVSGGRSHIYGQSGCYKGATVMATDLRASASLVLAGLAAKGSTQVRRIYHLERGYEKIEEKLSRLGAKIERVLEEK